MKPPEHAGHPTPRSRRPVAKKARRPRFFEREAIRFSCQACGQCCHQWEGRVHLFPSDMRRMAGHLGIPTRGFRHRFVRRDDDGDLELVLREDGACSMLGANGLCLVHDAKPVLCQTFPVWDDVVSSRRVWDRYARRCPGMGRGEPIPIDEIRRKLEENRQASANDDAKRAASAEVPQIQVDCRE